MGHGHEELMAGPWARELTSAVENPLDFLVQLDFVPFFKTQVIEENLTIRVDDERGGVGVDSKDLGIDFGLVFAVL